MKATFIPSRRNHVHPKWVLHAAALLGVFAAGCATTPTPDRASAPATPRPQLGTVAVVPGDLPPPHVWFHRESKTKSARLKAHEEWQGGFSGPMRFADSIASRYEGPPETGGELLVVVLPYLGVALVQSVFQAAAGAIRGASMGVAPLVAEKAEEAFSQAMASADVQRRLPELVCNRARARTAQPVVLLPSRRARDILTVSNDATLEIEILSLGFHTASFASSRLEFRAVAYAKLTRSESDEKLAVCIAKYASGKHRVRRLGEWAADDARLLREELDRCQAVLADQIVGELLGMAPAQIQTHGFIEDRKAATPAKALMDSTMNHQR